MWIFKEGLINTLSLVTPPWTLKWLNEALIFTNMSDLELQVPIPVEKNEKIGEKNSKNFGPTPGTPWVPHISAPRTNIEKPLGNAS